MEEKFYSPAEMLERYPITRNTLRLYAKNGLLPPSRVNADNGYTSYSEAALLRLENILLLKDVGLSLSEISAWLDGEISAEERKKQLQIRIEAAQKALELLENPTAAPGQIYTAPEKAKVVHKDQPKQSKAGAMEPAAAVPQAEPEIIPNPPKEEPKPEPKRRRSDDFIIL